MSICIFPGTFNPIHEAHLKMAEFALQKYDFEKNAPYIEYPDGRKVYAEEA